MTAGLSGQSQGHRRNMTKIDAHQHFWNPARGDYNWMPMDNPTLARTYSVSDLECELRNAGVRQTVLIQAAPTVHETEYMLGIADSSPFVAGVVGWIDFEDKGDLRTLERLANHPKFVGVRPMIQDIPDDGWMLRGDVQWAFSAAADLGLTFDALGYPRHIANFAKLFQRHPDMRAVIDHCLKPAIACHTDETFRKWADGISRIADDTSACCKISGLLTEAGDNPNACVLRPYIGHVLDKFGPERLMWGSDWPVCLQKTGYTEWLRTAENLIMADGGNECHRGHDISDRGRIFGRTAAEFYSLPTPADPSKNSR